MQQDLSEVGKILETHEYSMTSVLLDAAKTFKLPSIIKQVGFEKAQGYGVTEIIMLMMLLPFLVLNSVNDLFTSHFREITTMRKDAIYRLQNDERIPWRSILYGVVTRFQRLVNPQKTVAPNSALIADDTTDARTGFHIENISHVFDHVEGRRGTKLGFKDLVLGWFDGTSFLPVDFSIHSEKPLRGKRRKAQYHKDCIPGSPGATRRKECATNKIDQTVAMIKRAVKHGIRVRYVLVDSWFSSKGFIQAVRQIRHQAMHVVCGVRKDKRKYEYQGVAVDAKTLLTQLQKAGKASRCRKLNTRYFEVVVQYEGVGEVKLYFCRFPYAKEWRLFLSTDTALSFVKMMEIYTVRWTIEVFFKEMKQHLRLGRCQSRDFDAQIAHVTLRCITYIFLAYLRRVDAYESLGLLFEGIVAELREKNVAERLWALFEDLLQAVLSSVAESGPMDLQQFQQSPQYAALKERFEKSFLGNPLRSLDMAG
jgi:hypothetical protein